jgi:hypothetical protein
VGFANAGNWGNCTRLLSAGFLNVYMRATNQGGLIANCGVCPSYRNNRVADSHTKHNELGEFCCFQLGGRQSYIWVPLLDTNEIAVKLSGGQVTNIRVTTFKSGYNANNYILVSTNTLLIPPPGTAQLQIGLAGKINGEALTVTWSGRINDSVTNLYWTTNLTPPVAWRLFTNAQAYTNGQGSVSLTTQTHGCRFYRLQK